MQSRPTKKLAKYIDKFVKDHKLAECAEFHLVSACEYPGLFSDYADYDYDAETGKYRVIKVFYPFNYYAMPCVISTPVLIEERHFHYGKEKSITLEQFNHMLTELIYI